MGRKRTIQFGMDVVALVIAVLGVAEILSLIHI